jgi:putative FmdB family regulatory protein
VPVYSYRCENCGAQFERTQRFSDDPVTVCPECEASSVRRVIHPAGIIFKGSGWYVKDSKASNPAGKPGTITEDKSSKSSSEQGDSSSEKSDSSSEKSDSSTKKSDSSTKKSDSSSESSSNASEN